MHTRVVFISFVSLLLAGCLSGGGGNSPSVSNTPPSPAPSPAPSPPPNSTFTSWATVPTPGTATIKGPTLEGSYTSSPQNNFAVTSVSNATTGNGTVQLTYDNNRNVTAASVGGALSSASFNTSNGDTIMSFANTNFVAESKDGSKVAAGVNPYLNGFNYQSYGIWETGLGTGSGNFGAISVGSQTQPASIPTSGSATFAGSAGGAYVDSAGANYVTGANATLNTNFGTRNINFSTTNTQTANTSTGVITSAPGLNMTGTLSYNPGVNGFSGNISTANAMTGSASGVFYGPSADEVGGTFATRGPGVQTYVGGFGAKR